ncbi:MAG: mechanosensitive ion channel [Candidatus Zixiibacteriota bacterium]
MEFFENWLLGHGFSEHIVAILSKSVLIVGVLVVALVSYIIARRLLVNAIAFLVRRSKTKWDDILLEHKVFGRLSHIAPALVIYLAAQFFPTASSYVQRIAMIYMAFAGLSALNAFLNAISAIYNTFEMSKQRPIKGYIQILKIIFFILVTIIGLATIMGQKPWALLTGLGAMTAVLMLIFRDTILGLVAGVQLSANDMVRIGDWIEMPKYGADGDVIDISLHTVKVQNWDKTISSIPAYALISESFRNWRGMSESGGRRIKRAIHLDIASIRFCDEEMISRFSKIQYISEYIAAKKREIDDHNTANKIDVSILANGRHMTNIGTFRAYVSAYLKNNPKIHQEMTFLVRQLPPGDTGLPLEIYVFSNDQVWANYEAIQADIFDHLLAVVPLFDLRVFQRPSGHDLRQIGLSGGRNN